MSAINLLLVVRVRVDVRSRSQGVAGSLARQRRHWRKAGAVGSAFVARVCPRGTHDVVGLRERVPSCRREVWS